MNVVAVKVAMLRKLVLLKLRVLNPVMAHSVSKVLVVKVAKVFLTVKLLAQVLLGKRLAMLQVEAAVVWLLRINCKWK